MPAMRLSDVGLSCSMPPCLHTATFPATEMFAVRETSSGQQVGNMRRMTDRWKNNLTAWRRRSGLTMEALAAALEPPSSKGTISQYESGKRRPSQKRLDEIAKVLGTTRGSLLDDTPDVAESSPDVAFAVSTAVAVAHIASEGPLPEVVLQSFDEILRKLAQLSEENEIIRSDPGHLETALRALIAQHRAPTPPS